MLMSRALRRTKLPLRSLYHSLPERHSGHAVPTPKIFVIDNIACDDSVERIVRCSCYLI